MISGEEITGHFKMRAKGNEGDVIEIRCGEELQEDGRVRYKMRCNWVRNFGPYPVMDVDRARVLRL